MQHKKKAYNVNGDQLFLFLLQSSSSSRSYSRKTFVYGPCSAGVSHSRLGVAARDERSRQSLPFLSCSFHSKILFGIK